MNPPSVLSQTLKPNRSPLCSQLTDISLSSILNSSNSHLTSLSFSGCKQLELLPLSEAPNLVVASLDGCKKLRGILSELEHNRSLKHLNIDGCQKVKDDGFPLLSRSGYTGTLEFLSVNGILSLAPLARMTSLTVLRLNNSSFHDVSPLASMINLFNLFLDNCINVVDLKPLSHITSLEALHCFKLSRLESGGWPRFADHFSKLTALTVWSCKAMDNVDFLDGCTSLDHLKLSFCNIENLSALATCSGLESVVLTYCKKVMDLSPFQYCSRLKFIKMDKDTPVAVIQSGGEHVANVIKHRGSYPIPQHLRQNYYGLFKDDDAPNQEEEAEES